MQELSPIEKVIDLCKQYNISPTYNNQLVGDATGIGDILFRILCIKNNLIPGPFNINLTNFTRPYYGTDPINQLEFRIRLIIDLFKFNNISANSLNFFFNKNLSYIDNNQYLPYNSINNYKLNMYNNDSTGNTDTEPYIIFHTKCRHNSTEDYTFLKHKIKEFCINFKSKYKIYIMGEKMFPINEETIMHGITTIYDELLELKHNNDLIDISIENIYNNLDYDDYKKYVLLIQNAKHNICFSQGGQLSTCLMLGNSTIFYFKINNLDINDKYLANNNHFHCKTIESCIELIKNTSSV
jgi:hypothetical protein